MWFRLPRRKDALHFVFQSATSTLLQELRTALGAHRPAAVRALLAAHGEYAFARSLSQLSERARDDALSMLPRECRARLITTLVARHQSGGSVDWLRPDGGAVRPVRTQGRSQAWARS